MINKICALSLRGFGRTFFASSSVVVLSKKYSQNAFVNYSNLLLCKDTSKSVLFAVSGNSLNSLPYQLYQLNKSNNKVW